MKRLLTRWEMMNSVQKRITGVGIVLLIAIAILVIRLAFIMLIR